MTDNQRESAPGGAGGVETYLPPSQAVLTPYDGSASDDDKVTGSDIRAPFDIDAARDQHDLTRSPNQRINRAGVVLMVAGIAGVAGAAYVARRRKSRARAAASGPAPVVVIDEEVFWA